MATPGVALVKLVESASSAPKEDHGIRHVIVVTKRAASMEFLKLGAKRRPLRRAHDHCVSHLGSLGDDVVTTGCSGALHSWRGHGRRDSLSACSELLSDPMKQEQEHLQA